MLRERIDRGVSVCPFTVTDGWSGAGGAAAGVCASIPTAATYAHRLNFDIFIAAFTVVILDSNYTDGNVVRNFDYNGGWP